MGTVCLSLCTVWFRLMLFTREHGAHLIWAVARTPVTVDDDTSLRPCSKLVPIIDRLLQATLDRPKQTTQHPSTGPLSMRTRCLGKRLQRLVFVLFATGSRGIRRDSPIGTVPERRSSRSSRLTNAMGTCPSPGTNAIVSSCKSHDVPELFRQERQHRCGESDVGVATPMK